MAIKRWNASTSQWELVGTPGTATPAAIGAAALVGGNTFTSTQRINGRLAIQSTGDRQVDLIGQDGNTYAYIGTTGGIGSAPANSLKIRSDAGGIVFGYQGFEQARIDPSSNFAVNTTQVLNRINVGGNLGVYFSPSSYPNMRGIFEHSGQTAGLRIISQGVNLGGDVSGAITFWTSTANSANASTDASIVERMRITASGKLLLGNSSEPSNPYSVHITGGVMINQNTDISPNSSAAGQLTIGGNGYSGFVTLDATAMHIGHNSGSRDLILATDETERLRVQAGGNIRIIGGASAVGTGPKYIISISGNVDESTYLGKEAYWTLIGANANEGWKFRSSNTNNVLTINAGLNGYGATLLGSLTQNASDIRLKKNIASISDALDKVKSLNGFTYNWNELANELIGFNMEENEVGLFAQEVNNVLPEAVKIAPFDTDNGINESVSGENYLTVQYEKIIPLLVEAIKELADKVESLSNND
jgi:hypothetical protein